MQWDLGLEGLGVLALMSLALGVFTQFMFHGRSNRWLWLVASGACFVGGLVISEVWFGWATEEDLQPNIDGLSFDEVLLGCLVAAIVVVAVRSLLAQRHHHAST